MARWNRRAIVGCEMSGRVGHELAKHGWQVITADILPSERPDRDYITVRDENGVASTGSVRHYQGDVRDLFSWDHPMNVRRKHDRERAALSQIQERMSLFDLGIFHPPCTHLTLGGARYWRVKREPQLDQDSGQYTLPSLQDEAAAFFMEMVNAPVARCAVENPRGDMTRRYREPDQYVQPWMFGDALVKATGLWLRDLPPLVQDRRVDAIIRVTTGGGSHRTDMRRDGKSNNGYEDSRGRKNRHIMRSLTPPGLARAMAEQWTAYIGEQERAAA
jgi:hypothetical protein